MEKIFNKVAVGAIATALPKETLKLETLSESFGEDTIKKIIGNTGITEVHISPPEKTSSDYCVAAAEKLFEENEIDPAEIDAIIFVTDTPNYICPPYFRNYASAFETSPPRHCI